MKLQTETIAVIGLGYVGLPLVHSLARKFEAVQGYDTDQGRVTELAGGFDRTGELDAQELAGSSAAYSADESCLDGASFYIVTVPTPIDGANQPDLGPVRSACEVIGRHLAKGAVIVFESTVYPGVTDNICGPLLEKVSGLTRGVDFHLGYSPERINPGDKVNRLETITKIVSGEDAATLERVKAVYGAIIEAGLHIAPTIKVAEAAKVIENTQRDVNIALMNEISMIFERMDINTQDVLEAAGTKWNFLRFTPGLVGGHCIGVDPYYLTSASERLGYRAEVILASRRINDSMGMHIARKLIKMMIASNIDLRQARIGVFGITFKENVPDIRNSKVIDIISELKNYGFETVVVDPCADKASVKKHYDIDIADDTGPIDAAIFAVPHDVFANDLGVIFANIKPGGVLIDVKGLAREEARARNVKSWSM